MDNSKMTVEIEKFKKILEEVEGARVTYGIRDTKDSSREKYVISDTVASDFETLDKIINDLTFSIEDYIDNFKTRWVDARLRVQNRTEEKTLDEKLSTFEREVDETQGKQEELAQKYKDFLDKMDGGVSVLTCLEEFESLDSSLKSINMDEYIKDFFSRWSQLKEFIRKSLVEKEIKRQKRKETIGNVLGISIFVIIALAFVGGTIAYCIFIPNGIHTVLGVIIVFAMAIIWLALFLNFDKRNLVPWFIIITAILGMSAVGLLFISNEIGVFYYSGVIGGNLFSTFIIACNEAFAEESGCVRTPGQHKLNRAVAIITGIVVTIFSLIIFYILVPHAIHWAIALVACAIYVTIWTIIGVKAKGNFLPACIIVNTLVGLGSIGLFFIPQVGISYGICTLSGIAISLVIGIIISIVRRNKAKQK